MSCSVANTYLKLQDCVVSGASFLTEFVFECDVAHRRSVVVLCLMYNYGAQPVPYVLVHVTCGALITIIIIIKKGQQCKAGRE